MQNAEWAALCALHSALCISPTRTASVICASQDILDEVAEKLRLKFGFSARHARLLTSFVRRQTVAAGSIV